MLIVFAEVKQRDEQDLNEWYNREHIDERVNLPGFKRGRRYLAVKGAPKYLATYECSKVGDLGTPAYLALLANQTPWSQKVTASFTRFTRYTLRMQVDLTHGTGGSVTCVRFVPDPRTRKPLIAWLRDQALPRAIARHGMLGAAAGENDVDIANAPAKAQGLDYPRADDAEWVVLLESAEAAAGQAAARALFTLTALKKFGTTRAATVGSYRLLYGNSR